MSPPSGDAVSPPLAGIPVGVGAAVRSPPSPPSPAATVPPASSVGVGVNVGVFVDPVDVGLGVAEGVTVATSSPPIFTLHALELPSAESAAAPAVTRPPASVRWNPENRLEPSPQVPDHRIWSSIPRPAA